MKPPIAVSTVVNHFLVKLFKKPLVTNIDTWCSNPKGRALIYHKTDSLIPGYIFDYLHCNYWEVKEQVRILNELGYVVDVIDRSIDDNYLPEDQYDIFIGIGTDGSGRHFTKYAKELKRAKVVLYNQGQFPTIRNANVDQRLAAFNKRHNQSISATRRSSIDNMQPILEITNYIVLDGNEQGWLNNTNFGSRIMRFNHATHPKLRLSNQALVKKSPQKFLMFAGDGNLLKGVDLVIEAFANHSDLHVYICTTLEPEFASFYAQVLTQSPNIHIENFVRVGSKRFNQLTEQCAYVLTPSASEGFGHSTATCMRRGLIPVITKNVSIDITPFGHHLEDESVDGLAKTITTLAKKSDQELKRAYIESYIASFQYTEDMYTKTMTEILSRILDDHSVAAPNS